MYIRSDIDRIRKTIETTETEKEKKQNEKIIKNNLKLKLQQIFYKNFSEKYDVEEVKRNLNLLENRNIIIFELCKNYEDFTPYINQTYSKELKFIYDIFKNNKNALEDETKTDWKTTIYNGIEDEYKKHGINVYYTLEEGRKNFLQKFDIDTYQMNEFYKNTNKKFYKEYKNNTSCLTFKNISLAIIGGFTFGFLKEFKKNLK